MKVSLALKIFKDYQKANLRPSTIAGYRYLMNLFEEFFGGKDVSSLASEDVYHFLAFMVYKSQTMFKFRKPGRLVAGDLELVLIDERFGPFLWVGDLRALLHKTVHLRKQTHLMHSIFLP